ncbi:MAG: hypothetical protein BWY63_03646 [Chloroflexi bacterium ADurb.Bin360]|nr:MAG: hypothetical protein BWY63_03646 [Chloroflexi bacterium ADurb.Bin360]
MSAEIPPTIPDFSEMDEVALAQYVVRKAPDRQTTYAMPYLNYIIAGCWGHEQAPECFTRALCNLSSWRGVEARAWKEHVRVRYGVK